MAVKVLFQNAQWRVTEYGLEARDRDYPIARARLGETCNYTGEVRSDWLLHMAGKRWVDFDAFVEAFGEALRVHQGRYRPIDPAVIADSIAHARLRAFGLRRRGVIRRLQPQSEHCTPADGE